MNKIKLSNDIKIYCNGVEIKPKIKIKNLKTINYLERYIKAVILSNNNCNDKF